MRKGISFLIIFIAVFSFTAHADQANFEQVHIIYVDDDATGANDGTSWENAYVYLQDALVDANDSDKPVEIRVAQGIYKPDQGAGQTSGDREASFHLVSGTIISGGYAGLNPTDPNIDPNTRNIELYKTILSGDLNGDDAEVQDAQSLLENISREDNSYHVLIPFYPGPNAIVVIDSLYINGGNANGEDINHYGGGILWYGANLDILNCTFKDNTSNQEGGAIYNSRLGVLNITNCKFICNASEDGGAVSSPDHIILTDCRFTKNYAVSDGGAVDAGYGAPVLINCIFEYNSSYRGGGMHNVCDPTHTNCTFTLINCKFIGNYAEGFGGGFYNLNVGPPDHNTSQLIDSCTFKDNHAGIYGGGIYNAPSSRPSIKNCLLVNNSSSSWGGALHFWNSDAEIINCTIGNNTAARGGAIACGYADTITSSNVKVDNCIIWDNSEEIYKYDDSQITIAYSCIQGLISGRSGLPMGIINQDPLFADPNNGDYHLKSQAGRFDPNSGSWVIDDVTSPCIDAGDPNTPIGDEPEPNGGRINMGAYGGTIEASKSYLDESLLETIQSLK
jgi:hypothetical protein